MKTVKIIRYPAAIGYGERYDVNDKDKEVFDFFEKISLWHQNSKTEKDFSTTITFELPLGVTYENNKLLQFALDKLNVDVVDIADEWKNRRNG